MPTLTIDGKPITVEPGTKLIEACRRLGSDIPYYCYHPGLSIAGNCRICMVEVEKSPKTQIACNMDCTDGMVVHTQSEKAKETRRHILEFLLANHPLDCPVCDQAGECWLQDYYMRFGLYDPRFLEQKTKKVKAEPIGPTVMLDAERCILCSRCVRFCDEISKTSELGIVNRGDHAEITVHPDKELNNVYSGNVVDICPVGALTDRDFRFKCRVWYLKEQKSVCNGCSRGCNIDIHYNLDRPQHGNGERVMRLKPRENPAVNQWWMCDEGRYGYKFIDENRLENLISREKGPAAPAEIQWKAVLDRIAERIKKTKKTIAVFLSPQLSNEELYLAKKLFSGKAVSFKTFLISPFVEGYQDDFLVRADKNPNSKGAGLLGFSCPDAGSVSVAPPESFYKEASKGGIEAAFIFGQDLLGEGKNGNFMQLLGWSVYIGSNQNLTSESCTYLLPAATHAEKDGTFTNFQGRVQRFWKAFEPLADSRPEWKILTDLAVRLGENWNYQREERIFSEMAVQIPAFHGMTYAQLGTAGVMTNGKTH